MSILVAGMLLGSFQLFYSFIQSIIKPPFGLIEVHELLKSMVTMIGIGVLITSLGLGYFLHHFKSQDLND